MATNINDGNTEEPPVLTANRYIAGPPWRSAQRTWSDLSTFWLDLLKQRAFPGLDEMAVALRALAPLGQRWIIQHLLEQENLVFDAGDLRVHIRVTYQPDRDEDLSPLPVELLDDLPAGAALTLSVHDDTQVQESDSASLITAAEHGLTVLLTPEPREEQSNGDDQK